MDKDGGPAFPGGELPEHPNHPVGMSLRDYFAGQAISIIPVRSWDDIKDDREKVMTWARTAYQIADAMLAEREKRRGGE